MGKLLFFVEGIADQVFLRDLIEYSFGIAIKKIKTKSGITFISDDRNYEILATGGWNKLDSKIFLDRMSSNNNGTNITIFDADENPVRRREELVLILDSIENQSVFLFPDNENQGDLENLLLEVLQADKKKAFESCYTSYETCLKGIEINGVTNLTIPNKKHKVHSLLSVFLSKSQQDKAKERNRDYFDKDFWNLDSDALKPLIEFLTPFFKN